MQQKIQTPPDIRDAIFASVGNRTFMAKVITESSGIIAGSKRLAEALMSLGVTVNQLLGDGAAVDAGAVIATITGQAKQIAMAEEIVIGIMAKPSGIATAAQKAVQAAGPDLRIVCGAWKKMPPEIKHIVREAVACGQAAFRISDQPFLYLDKNFVRMLGGIEATLTAVRDMDDKQKVIQLKGYYGPVVEEALTAVKCGADIIMVDTGRLEDVTAVHEALMAKGWRDRVQIAFAKGIKIEAISELKGRGIDILDIGVAIIDAPLLDMKLEVCGEAAACS
ncbi:Quinolinate phosphoribosyl transferase [Thermosinus carboxydivorans Nor1]|uniref:Quinolinate phosphoribosyl transferase n=1 Tax=Thermosinus carboxydivorans Nor1 TaxID=401526 RepID=A1HNV9_9FIRM|nr:Quinolinate phosphoribosyl transferase [Thermosinus carboxydivorans]EAX48461.1 Quinolinate phosphoribosyl transferase [Thermosinus carboxydivorans Nor1]